MESWKKRLPEISKGYRKEDIYNLDETECLWRVLPETAGGLVKRQRSAKEKT